MISSLNNSLDSWENWKNRPRRFWGKLWDNKTTRFSVLASSSSFLRQILSAWEEKFKSTVWQVKESPAEWKQGYTTKWGWVRGLASTGVRYEVYNQPGNKKSFTFNVNTQHHANRAASLAQEDLDHSGTHTPPLPHLCCQCTGKFTSNTHTHASRIDYLTLRYWHWLTQQRLTVRHVCVSLTQMALIAHDLNLKNFI